MVPLLLFILACLLFAAALHPFASYPLTLFVLRRMQRPSAPDVKPSPCPSATRFAICTCAYNEEKVIEDKLQNLLAIKANAPGCVELMLYVDAASDGTAQIARRYADRVTVVIATERHGKTHGMNRLVAQTDAEVIVFTDANVMLDVDVLRHLAPYFTDPAIGCVCGTLQYTNANASVTAATGSLYWRLEEFVKREEGALASVMGADGSLFAIRRALHRPPPDYLIDDMYVSFHVLCSGHRIVQAKDVCAFEESVAVVREEFRRKVRIACQAFNVHRAIWPHLRRQSALIQYMYVSHKLIRWFSIYFLLIGYLCLFAATALAGHLGLALVATLLVCAMLVVGARFSITPLTQIVDVLIALAGAGVGIFDALRGRLYQTWKPAASLRS